MILLTRPFTFTDPSLFSPGFDLSSCSLPVSPFHFINCLLQHPAWRYNHSSLASIPLSKHLTSHFPLSHPLLSIKFYASTTTHISLPNSLLHIPLDINSIFSDPLDHLPPSLRPFLPPLCFLSSQMPSIYPTTSRPVPSAPLLSSPLLSSHLAIIDHHFVTSINKSVSLFGASAVLDLQVPSSSLQSTSLPLSSLLTILSLRSVPHHTFLESLLLQQNPTPSSQLNHLHLAFKLPNPLLQEILQSISSFFSSLFILVNLSDISFLPSTSLDLVDYSTNLWITFPSPSPISCPLTQSTSPFPPLPFLPSPSSPPLPPLPFLPSPSSPPIPSTFNIPLDHFNNTILITSFQQGYFHFVILLYCCILVLKQTNV